MLFLSANRARPAMRERATKGFSFLYILRARSRPSGKRARENAAGEKTIHRGRETIPPKRT